jgi:hypothetical protein
LSSLEGRFYFTPQGSNQNNLYDASFYARESESASDTEAILRQKALDAEREQLAAERRKIEAEWQQIAKVQRPSVSTTGETGRDGRFIAYNNGTVLDTKTNLMWAAKDNGGSTNWAEAKSYCENYRGGGYTDWRMPNQDELARLYDGNKSRPAACDPIRNIHVVTELIDITCHAIWASEVSGSSAAVFTFLNALRYTGWQSAGGLLALPVRSVK